jgi:hypothetical protein
MMQRIMNVMRGEGQRAAGTKSLPRRGTVSAFDFNNYAAKVIIQPEGFETGFLPIASSWVGNLWGMFCPPTPGDEVDVHFQEGGKNAAYISLRFFGNKARPVAVASGEFWLVHKSGSLIKLTNDGMATVRDSAGSFLTLNADGSGTFNGNLKVIGDLVVTGDVSDLNGAAESMAGMRIIYNTHTHPTPDGTSGAPNQQM